MGLRALRPKSSGLDIAGTWIDPLTNASWLSPDKADRAADIHCAVMRSSEQEPRPEANVTVMISTTTIRRGSGSGQLPAIGRFAPGPVTGFDRRWAPSHGKPFTARRSGRLRSALRKLAERQTVWPAKLGINACSAFRDRRSHLVALRQTKISAAEPASTWWPGERD